MQYIVLQPFKTPTHRFPVGAKIDDGDIDGALTALDWVERGYLSALELADEDIAALREEAVALGIEIDRRWGAKRLRDEIGGKKAAEQVAAEQVAAEQVAAEQVAAEQAVAMADSPAGASL